MDDAGKNSSSVDPGVPSTDVIRMALEEAMKEDDVQERCNEEAVEISIEAECKSPLQPKVESFPSSTCEEAFPDTDKLTCRASTRSKAKNEQEGQA